MKSFTSQHDELYFAAKAILEGQNITEGLELEEAFRPGGGMVPAPIGNDTVSRKGLKKLWGIKMRAGKWADTFIGLFDLPDGKPYGIIDAEGTTRYASVDLFNAAFKKLRFPTK